MKKQFKDLLEIVTFITYFSDIKYFNFIFYYNLVLITSLGDCIPECREEAIKNLVITDNMQIKLILNVAQRDEDFRVKKIAFNKILSDEKFNEINSKTIIDVLENLLGLHQRLNF